MKADIILYIKIFIFSISTLTCLYVSYLYSTILDLFPWGHTNGYFIWGLMICSIIIPIGSFLGIINLFISYVNTPIIFRFSVLMSVFFIYLPFFLGIDDDKEIFGRLLGFILPFFGIFYIYYDFKFTIQKRNNLK